MTSGLLFLLLFQMVLYKQKRCLLWALLFTVISGLAALYLLSLAEPYLGFSLPITKGTIGICAVLGAPGAVLLALGQIILQLI